MSTVRCSCAPLDVHAHLRLTEPPLCRRPPYWIFPGRASPDARGPPPYAVRLSADVPCHTPMCRRLQPASHGSLPVVLALQYVPARAGVSSWGLGRQMDPDGRLSVAVRMTVLMPWRMPLPGCLAHSRPPCLWLVPYAVELCHPRHDAPGQTRHRGLSGNRASLAP